MREKQAVKRFQKCITTIAYLQPSHHVTNVSLYATYYIRLLLDPILDARLLEKLEMHLFFRKSVSVRNIILII